MSELSIKSPSGVSKVYKLKRTNLVGRMADCDIVLEDKFVSRRHCKIEQNADGEYYVEDVGSSTGTFLNDDRLVERAPLKNGSVLKIGDFVVTFTIGAHSTTFGRRLTQSAFEAMRAQVNARMAKGA